MTSSSVCGFNSYISDTGLGGSPGCRDRGRDAIAPGPLAQGAFGRERGHWLAEFRPRVLGRNHLDPDPAAEGLAPTQEACRSTRN